MSMPTRFTPSHCSLRFTNPDLHLPSSLSHLQPPPPFTLSFPSNTSAATTLALRADHVPRLPVLAFSGGGGANGRNGRNSGGGGGGGGGGDGEEEEENEEEVERWEGNKAAALLALAAAKRTLESLPRDLAAAIEAGKVPGSVVSRYFELEKSAFFRWLLQFAGFKERLLADDLFFTKVFIECGIGLFTKTAAEYEKRKENFFNELKFVSANVVMAIVADFMLVFLPAPTVSLRPPISVNAGSMAKFFYGCPENAFQVALAGTSFSFLQRIGAIVRNGAKLLVVGTTSSLIGTSVVNVLINVKKAVDNSSADEIKNLPILATSFNYGVYMAVSSNLRYQVLAGIIEQRMLEPLLHQHKLMLTLFNFIVRTGNTYLGSLMWVDYMRLVGLSKVHQAE
ncbi:protein RETICULATA-RELATED 4, chloroplastic-like [Rhododendron vialii]|uniref:protein RETICULATA-RELATED 4, chloroplastic-like n=1 Tax=Rhododendron vialii TaxID=182163 RepID=UPI00265DD597|nr:protein RETICULATA-RELATED 4, chloroplastic-like [Rhododendron vialii]